MVGVAYKAIPSLRPFHMSPARVRVVRGPIGSGKTTAMLMELLRIACQQQPGPDGIRRTRMLVSRNTLPQLRTTCLVSILQQLRGLAQWVSHSNTVKFRFGNVDSEWLMVPLDSPENIQRLLSLELTYAWMSEVREMDPQLVRDAYSRTGRYPSIENGGCTRYGLIAESNSFRIDSPWFPLLEEERPKNWDYIVQPSALSPQADWLQYLPPDYYTDLIESNTPEWVEQYIENKYGESLDGQAVYKASFNADIHVAKETIAHYPGSPLLIGCDFARWPAAVICQIDATGRMLVLAEVERENVGIEMFARENLLPLLASARFHRCPSFLVGDPAGRQRSQIGEQSVFDALKACGFQAHPAVTNNIAPRLRAVEKFLIQSRNGKPAMLIDPSCRRLIEGFKWKYRFRKTKSGNMESIPEKVRPWADVHDALQYACLGTARTTMVRALQMLGGTNGQAQPRIRPAAWT